MLCFPLLHNAVASNGDPGGIKQLEPDVDMSSPHPLMGEMGQGQKDMARIEIYAPIDREISIGWEAGEYQH